VCVTSKASLNKPSKKKRIFRWLPRKPDEKKTLFLPPGEKKETKSPAESDRKSRPVGVPGKIFKKKEATLVSRYLETKKSLLPPCRGIRLLFS